ncbi:HTH_Tnp_Tc3_2 domain-containing protein [Trichonephila clavipes]|nr:HTH_Tnp_Tc3_2 domain-containing protein [Trichonephila clavipes]
MPLSLLKDIASSVAKIESKHPRNTNAHDDRAIIRAATSSRTASLESVRRHLPPSRHPVVSKETIQRRLAVVIWNKLPLKHLPRTSHRRQCRLDFCRSRASWSVTDWKRMVFSGESRFSLSADGQLTHMWRQSGHLSDSTFVVESYTAITQGMEGWEAICWDTQSPLVVLQRTLMTRSCVDEILTSVLLPIP